MYHLMRWRDLDAATRAAGHRYEVRLASSPTRIEAAAALRDLAGVDGHLVMDAAAMRVVRAAMPRLGMAAGDGGGLPVRTLTAAGARWDVTAEECRAALLAWRHAIRAWQPGLDLLLDGCGLAGTRRLDVWIRWLTFLTRAADHGGYRGHGVAPHRFSPHRGYAN